jgi:hypothetical protein
MENFILKLTTMLIPPEIWSIKVTYDAVTDFLEHASPIDLASLAVAATRFGIGYGLAIVLVRLLFGGHVIPRRYHAFDFFLPHLLSVALLAISLTGHPIYLSVILAPTVCWIAGMLAANVWTLLGPSPTSVSIVNKIPGPRGPASKPHWSRRLLLRVIGRPFQPAPAEDSAAR